MRLDTNWSYHGFRRMRKILQSVLNEDSREAINEKYKILAAGFLVPQNRVDALNLSVMTIQYLVPAEEKLL